jgi:hypothetical protein
MYGQPQFAQVLTSVLKRHGDSPILQVTAIVCRDGRRKGTSIDSERDTSGPGTVDDKKNAKTNCAVKRYFLRCPAASGCIANCA